MVKGIVDQRASIKLVDTEYEFTVETVEEGAPPIPLWKVGLVLLALFAGGAGAYHLTKGGEVYEL